MKRRWILLLAFAAVIGFSGGAYALTTIGTATYGGNDYNLICEEAQGLVWLDYTNPLNNWQTQVDWAAGLNSLGELTYNINPGISVNWTGNWRLPETVDGEHVWGYDSTTTGGMNVTTSEMGYLYYVSLGNLAPYDTNETYVGDGNWGLLNKGPFLNLEGDQGFFSYWSGTEYGLDITHAWVFDFSEGSQFPSDKRGYPYIWGDGTALAVRSGNVSSAAVPEPETMLLLGFGLTGLAGLKRKIKKS